VSAEAKNLKAIYRAIDVHRDGCPLPLVEIRMCGFEVERLGWDAIRGIPITVDDSLGTGRFKLVCEADLVDAPTVEVEEAIAA
jgi:hypothetical protein